MRLIIFHVLLLVGIAICQTQSPFQFPSFGVNRPSSINNGRYQQPALRTTTYRPFRPAPSIFGNVDNSGRYQPVLRTTTYRPYRPSVFGNVNNDNSGRYNPNTDGRYRPSNDGRYQPTDDGKYKYTDEFGKYKDSGHGKYINGKYVDGPYVDGKYVGDSSGFYDHDNNPYQHKDVGGGQYNGQNVPYDPYKDKQYPGGAYRGNQAGSGGNVPYKGNANVGFKPSSYQPSFSGAALPAVDPKYVDASGYSTLGVAQGLEKSNAAGLYDNRNYAIIVDEKQISPNGDYHYQYETENKIFGEEFSKVVSDTEERKNGYFKYTGPDSNVYLVTYNAGVQGFVPEAKHIPTEPPVPELIQRSLDYKRAHGLL